MILKFINLPFSNDSVINRYQLLIILTLGVYLNFFSIIDVGVVFDVIPYEHYSLYMVSGAIGSLYSLNALFFCKEKITVISSGSRKFIFLAIFLELFSILDYRRIH